MRDRSPTRDSLALSFALLFPLFMAWLYFVVMAGRGQQANPAFVLAYTAGKLIQLIFPAFYIFRFDRERLWPDRPTTRGLVLAVAFSALVAGAMFAAYFGWLAGSPRLELAAERIHGKLLESGLDSPAGFLLAAVFFCVVHALFEEYYWRWFIFGGLKRYVPIATAIVVSGLGSWRIMW